MLTTDDVRAHLDDDALAEALSRGDDVAAAARLSQLLTDVVPVSIDKMLAFAAATGLRARLHDTANNADHPARSLALAALDLFRGSVSDSFDTQKYGNLLDALVVTGVMTAEERAQLHALAVVPRVVTPSDVANAVRNGDGTSKL